MPRASASPCGAACSHQRRLREALRLPSLYLVYDATRRLPPIGVVSDELACRIRGRIRGADRGRAPVAPRLAIRVVALAVRRTAIVLGAQIRGRRADQARVAFVVAQVRVATITLLAFVAPEPGQGEPDGGGEK